jgi:hypothetical protein
MAPTMMGSDHTRLDALNVNRLEENIEVVVQMMRQTDKDDVRAVYVLPGRRPTYDELYRLRRQTGSFSMTVAGDGGVAVRRRFEPEIDTSGMIEWSEIKRPLERFHTAGMNWLRRQVDAWNAGFAGLHEGLR